MHRISPAQARSLARFALSLSLGALYAVAHANAEACDALVALPGQSGSQENKEEEEDEQEEQEERRGSVASKRSSVRAVAEESEPEGAVLRTLSALARDDEFAVWAAKLLGP